MRKLSPADRRFVSQKNRLAQNLARTLYNDLTALYSSWKSVLIGNLKRAIVRKKENLQDFLLTPTVNPTRFNEVAPRVEAVVGRRLKHIYAVNLAPDFPTVIGLAGGRKDALAGKWVRENGVKLAGFAETDNKRIGNLLANAISTGESFDKTLEKIENLFDGFSANRLRNISNGLTMTAQGYAQRDFWSEAAPDAAANFTKDWLPTVGGEFDREYHNDVGSVLFNEKFAVPTKSGGIVFMDLPRDITAPPEDTIRCGCQVRYRPPSFKG